jgi:nucleotide-binding universal stress UspA family protein
MIFERIVCGVDGSPESAEAVRQADLLMARGGRMLLVGVADVAVAVHGGFQAPAIEDMIETEARTALLDAEKSVAYGHPVHPKLVKGRPISCLMSAAREEDATLVAVGTHGSGRVAGILLGSVATAMLHEAPCSVLLARAAAAEWFPRSIVVGHDGSREAGAAALVGEELAERFGSRVSVLAATGGKILDIDGLRDVRGLQFDERKPVDARVEASKGCDLVIVGSRGLHGLESLGSVSERVAHQAACSVLVVREGSV